MFYTFAKRHLLTVQVVHVYAHSAKQAREQAKAIVGSGFLLFLVAVEG